MNIMKISLLILKPLVFPGDIEERIREVEKVLMTPLYLL